MSNIPATQWERESETHVINHLLFLRHFETRLNAEKRICGRSLEEPALNSLDVLCDIPMDTAICSPAVRCVQTMDALLRNMQIPAVFYDAALVERGMGVMEGELRSDMIDAYPELFSDGKFRLFETPPSGETFEAFYTRVREFWERVNKTYNGTLLVCSHNQFLRMLYLIVQELPVTEVEWKSLSFQHGIVERIY